MIIANTTQKHCFIACDEEKIKNGRCSCVAGIHKPSPSIYEIQIPVTSQEQADRLKQICLDNGLPIWNDGFNLIICEAYRHFQYDGCHFWIGSKSVSELKKLIEITEPEFINLLKPLKNEQ